MTGQAPRWLLVTVALGALVACAPTPGTTSPTRATLAPGGSLGAAAPVDAPSAPGTSVAPMGWSADIPDLPAPPGAHSVGFEQERDGDLLVIEVEYEVPADVESVRRHYRQVMQEHGWRAGDAEVDDAGWELKASRGAREVEIEIEPTAGGAHVEVGLTDLASAATGSP